MIDDVVIIRRSTLVDIADGIRLKRNYYDDFQVKNLRAEIDKIEIPTEQMPAPVINITPIEMYVTCQGFGFDEGVYCDVYVDGLYAKEVSLENSYPYQDFIGSQGVNEGDVHTFFAVANKAGYLPSRVGPSVNAIYKDGIWEETDIIPGPGTSTDPSALYQRVDYITSAEENTYPYIITDFYGDNTSGLEVIASFPVLQDRIPMGSRENSDPTRFYCVYPLSANSIYYGFDTGVTISCQLKVNTIYRCQTNFLNSRLVNVYEESGTRKGGGSISETLTAQTAPVAIFGYNSASSETVTSKREYKLYSARCSKGHEVVREYIPCYRKSDGVVGLYEKFSMQFLTAVEGAFTYGKEIDW